MSTESIKLHQLWTEFLQRWPLENLQKMSLAEYSTLGSQDTFTYWLEFKLKGLGNISGSSAKKFGIYARNLHKKSRIPKANDDYDWVKTKKLGSNAQEVFESIKQALVNVAYAARGGDLSVIEEEQRLSPMVKWKVAFLYQDRNRPICPSIYGDDFLKGVTGVDQQATHLQAVKTLMSAYDGTEDIFDFCRRNWESYKSSQVNWEHAEYDPGLSKEAWLELLKDSRVSTPNTLTVLARLHDFGGTATCSQLSEKFGKTPGFYNSNGTNFGRRVLETTKIPSLQNAEDQKTRYWVVPFLGRSVIPKVDGKVPGTFFWQIRPALREALKELDLSKYLQRDDPPPIDSNQIPEPNKDCHYWWLNANPKYWSFSHIQIGEEFSYTIVSESGHKRQIYQNFLDAQVGDVVICYESSPVKKIMGFSVVTRPHDGQEIFFKNPSLEVPEKEKRVEAQ